MGNRLTPVNLQGLGITGRYIRSYFREGLAKKDTSFQSSTMINGKNCNFITSSTNGLSDSQESIFSERDSGCLESPVDCYSVYNLGALGGSIFALMLTNKCSNDLGGQWMREVWNTALPKLAKIADVFSVCKQ